MTADPTDLEAFTEQGIEWPDENLEDDHPQRKGFVIEDDHQAAKVLQRLARWEREVARLEQLVADQAAQLAAFTASNLGTKDEPKGAAREVAFYRQALVAYYRDRAERDPDTPQTLKVPGGWIGRRKRPDTVEVSDPEAFVQWAIEHDRVDLISDIVPAGKTELKNGLTPQSDPAKAERGERLHFVDEDGAAVPGVTYVVGEDRYEAKVAPSEKP